MITTIILRIFSVLAWIIGLGMFIFHGSSVPMFVFGPLLCFAGWVLWASSEPKKT